MTYIRLSRTIPDQPCSDKLEVQKIGQINDLSQFFVKRILNHVAAVERKVQVICMFGKFFATLPEFPKDQ